MKQEEKKKLSREKILKAAIEEFGTKGFQQASLNNICANYKISKGLIYHYFENKDNLYLNCIKICFDEFTKFLGKEQYDFSNPRQVIKKYLSQRSRFLQTNPYYSKIFFTTIFQQPKHLKIEIKELRKEFDEQASNFYKNLLKNIELRNNVTIDEAMEYFFFVQETFNQYFQVKDQENLEFSLLIEEHENKISKMLDLMLYGIIKEE